MPQLTVILPDTVDPHMVDQLAAAVQRMGGHIQPEVAGPTQPQNEGQAINQARSDRGLSPVPQPPGPKGDFRVNYSPNF